MNRVSETQIQVGENCNWITLRVKLYTGINLCIIYPVKLDMSFIKLRCRFKVNRHHVMASQCLYKHTISNVHCSAKPSGLWALYDSRVQRKKWIVHNQINVEQIVNSHGFSTKWFFYLLCVHPTVYDRVVHGVGHGQPVDNHIDMLYVW